MMRNTVQSNSGGAAAGAQLAVAVASGIERAVTLPNGSRGGRRAPKSFTGCVSELSSCAAPQHAYADALKSYAQVYEAYQAYLTPADVLARHDYDLVGVAVAGEHQLGCLNEELVECTLPPDDISDDDIETCGYLGWIHHS